MNSVVIIFLLFVCVFSGLSATSNDDFIRVPLSATKTSRNRRAAVDSNGNKIELQNDKDQQYGFPITVGTPPQSFNVIMDSGSADFWIASLECEGAFLCGIKNRFNTYASSTYKPMADNPTFELEYDIGKLSGVRAKETVSIGNLTIKDQVIGIATEETEDAYLGPFAGVFGLAFKELSITDGQSTPIDNLYEQGQIKKRLACIKLNEEDEAVGGELIIGGCDTEADYWVPVARSGFWQVNLTKVEVKTEDGEVKATFCDPQRPCIAILDTGADDISAPLHFLNPIAEAYGATLSDDSDGGYLRPCSGDNVPNLEFTFGEAKIVMKPADLFVNLGDTCDIGLSESDDPGFTLGDPFLRRFTFILDMENNRVGFGNIKTN